MRKAPLLASIALLLAVPALGQALKGHNAKSPVDVEANSIEVQDRADRAVFSGKVVARQAGLTMTAGRLVPGAGALTTIAWRSASPTLTGMAASGTALAGAGGGAATAVAALTSTAAATSRVINGRPIRNVDRMPDQRPGRRAIACGPLPSPERRASPPCGAQACRLRLPPIQESPCTSTATPAGAGTSAVKDWTCSPNPSVCPFPST